MDSSILKHSNLLKNYSIDLEFDSTNKENKIKELKQKIDMIMKTRAVRLTASRQAAVNKEKETDDEHEKSVLMEQIKDFDMRMEALKAKHLEMMNTNDIYELICFYLKCSSEEYSYSYGVRVSKHQEDDKEGTKEKVELYKYVASQLSTSNDVKIYIEQILPLLDSLDIHKMNLNRFWKGKDANKLAYTYKVSMYDKAQMLLDMQTDTEAIRIYTFGAYQYKSDTIEVFTPYEILGIVKKDAENNITAYSGIMSLRECREVEATNLNVLGSADAVPFGVTSVFKPNKPSEINVKYTVPQIPANMREFMARIAANSVVLNNAKKNNKGFIGVVEHDMSRKSYGGYRLAFDALELEELTTSLSVAMERPGEIVGRNVEIYGNNLRGILTMAEFESRAAGERMEFVEKEKTGMTQGEE